MYICPMHPEIKQDKPGHCPICGMNLVKGGNHIASAHVVSGESQTSYWPLVLIIGLIAVATAVVAVKSLSSGSFAWGATMEHFMAGFFLVFSGFKLLDLKGFAHGYFTYDLLAKRWFGYGYVYPFLELILGLLFLAGWGLQFANIGALILMTFSGLGVAQKLRRHERFQCACLGTFLKIPLTKVTLIEDFGMAAMAAIMLFMLD